MDYYSFKDIEPSGNVGYRMQVYDLDSNVEYDAVHKVEGQPDSILPYFFAVKKSNYTLDKENTYFSEYTHFLTGVNVTGTITFRDSQGNVDGSLMYVSFHIVDLGPYPDINQHVVSVHETPMAEFINGEKRTFRESLSNIQNSNYYQIFFNVYTVLNDQSSIIYSSAEEYPEYDPIVITRVTIDNTEFFMDSTRVSFKIGSIRNKETDPNRLYRVTIQAIPTN
jgi:hypothetical protein